jgi:hypothetical protein
LGYFQDICSFLQFNQDFFIIAVPEAYIILNYPPQLAAENSLFVIAAKMQIQESQSVVCEIFIAAPSDAKCHLRN